MKSTCRCGTTWGGLRAEHCTVCHQTFSGNTLGDAHRVGEYGVNRRCLSIEEMTDKGWRLTDPKQRLWRGPELTPEQKDRLGY